MFVPPVVLAFSSLDEGAVGLAAGMVGAGAMLLGAWLLREGLRAEAAYNDRPIARRPALPRKILAAIMAGLGIGVATNLHDPSVLDSVLTGAVTLALHIGAFGIDPLTDKRVEGIDDFQQDRVARVVEEAEAYLEAMAGQVATLKDRPLSGRVASFQTAARRMIRTVQEDPRDLTGARKFLGVYLMGARDAAVRYAEIARRQSDTVARDKFLALLDDLELNFAAKTDHLLSDTRADLDIEIKVLRDRLSREGITGK